MITLDILYEDDAIIAVNKPPRLLIVPDRWDRNLPTIQDMLREYLRKKMVGEHPNIRVVHRLDKDTSGVILLAKNV
ncbi:MAG TPA: pseudouridine synthase, partial [Acidobacteriota bacterium]